MKVLSKSLAAMVAAATLVGGGAFAVAGTAYAADNDAITVTPNPWYANSFDGWGTSLAWFANATGSLGEESAITTNLGDDASKAKAVEYGKQLRTKQHARRFYGVLEGQFRHYFEMAEKMPGVTGENLLRILESRLDNVVYRLGFADSRAQARQLVLHGHFRVNGRKVTIPSFLTKVGQTITVKDGSRQLGLIKDIVEKNSGRTVPKWLEVNREAMEAKIVAVPEREDIDLPIEETLIVELYSK